MLETCLPTHSYRFDHGEIVLCDCSDMHHSRARNVHAHQGIGSATRIRPLVEFISLSELACNLYRHINVRRSFRRFGFIHLYSILHVQMTDDSNYAGPNPPLTRHDGPARRRSPQPPECPAPVSIVRQLSRLARRATERAQLRGVVAAVAACQSAATNPSKSTRFGPGRRPHPTQRGPDRPLVTADVAARNAVAGVSFHRAGGARLSARCCGKRPHSHARVLRA